MKKLILLVFLSLTATLFSFSQEITVSGVITDASRNPLPGVTIQVKGTTQGTITDFDGKYTINVQKDQTLVYSMVGMLTEEIQITNQNLVNLTLVEDLKELDEVVVIGYGTVKKSDLTGSVSTVKAKDLLKITTMNPVQNLQGRVSGVQVTSSSGAPGATPVVRVRGVGTFNNSAPIYVVDGVILDDISFLNSSDISSMEILKDASATAIYGSRGANGVIMVTTKSGTGSNGKTTFSYSGDYGIQHLTKKIDLLNGREFAIVSNMIQNGTFNNVDAVPNTDWQDLIFHNSPVTNHQISASGSSDKVQYYIGVGYYKQKGIIDKSSYERLSIKINNTYKLTDFFTLGNNLTFNPFKQEDAPNVTYQAYRASPVVEPYRADGSFAGVAGVGNPLASLEYSNNRTKGIRAVGNFYGEFKFLDAFTIKSSFGIDGLYKKNVNYTPAHKVLYYDGSESMQVNETSDLVKEFTENFTWLWENTLNYYKDFGENTFNAVMGYTMQNSGSEILKLTGENILRDGEDFWYFTPSYITDNTLDNEKFKNNVDENLNYSMISYLFRANYTHQNKYIFTATFRRDGSSKFNKENRYSYFPSFALGWNVSEESFMQNVPYLSKLKVRASWGKIGNEKIAYPSRYSLTKNVYAIFGDGDVSYPGVTYAKSGNPDLKWETTTQTDLGLEIGLFEGKLNSEFDYYHRVTDDILVELSTPGHLGNGQGQKVRYNAGKVLNSGFEANVNWKDKIGDFNYSIGVLATTVHNEVLSVGGNSGADSLLYGGDIKGYVTQTREGIPIGSFYGYKTDGIFQNEAELNAYPHTSTASVGSLRRVDYNGDGILNGNDRTNIGSPIPKIIFGLNIDLEYKNFDFSFGLQGQAGNKIFNGKEMVRPDQYNFEKHVLDAWAGEGTSNSEPAPSWGGYNYDPSDKFIQDGSYARIRNIILGYTLPESITEKYHIGKLRIYVKGDNIYTFTKYTGYSPEIASSDVLANCIDMGVYPISAIYSFGVNLTF
ncbi:MAG TPA: TonB-dependent receptor [Marinilabiliales bacterium]|nr:TonB-dependent receptor [Marinilabiliales bacterium]